MAPGIYLWSDEVSSRKAFLPSGVNSSLHFWVLYCVYFPESRFFLKSFSFCRYFASSASRGTGSVGGGVFDSGGFLVSFLSDSGGFTGVFGCAVGVSGTGGFAGTDAVLVS